MTDRQEEDVLPNHGAVDQAVARERELHVQYNVYAWHHLCL